MQISLKGLKTMLAVVLCVLLPAAAYEARPKVTTSMAIYSPGFTNNGLIPRKYTADGANISPPLSWSGVPKSVKSFALICDDPDAPSGTFVHWVVYNLPAASKGLPENAQLGLQGLNDSGGIGYFGPAPPSGVHRYVFKLYALNAALELEAGATKSALVTAMNGHIVAQCKIVGKYRRK